VAPWINTEREVDIDFFDFKIDKNLLQKTNKLKIFISKDDDIEMIKTVDKLKNEINDLDIEYFENMGHFCLKDMNTREFPELLEYILN